MPSAHPSPSASPASPADSSIPSLAVIDLSRADDPAERADFLKQLHAAARDTGFLYLTGHGISEAETARILELTRAFFELPEADRLAVSNLNSPTSAATPGSGTS